MGNASYAPQALCYDKHIMVEGKQGKLFQSTS